MFKRLRLLLKSKHQLFDQNQELVSLLSSDIMVLTERIKKLDNSKLYVIEVNSEEEVHQTRKMLDLITLPWSLPKIIITTKTFQEKTKTI